MSEGPEEKARPSSHKGLALFEKGNEAALRNNYDYAIEMYLKALKEEPGNLKYRQALRRRTKAVRQRPVQGRLGGLGQGQDGPPQDRHGQDPR